MKQVGTTALVLVALGVLFITASIGLAQAGGTDAVSSQVAYFYRTPQYGQQIVIENVYTGQTMFRSDEFVSVSMPNWSPDGKQLAFVGHEPITLDLKLYVLDARAYTVRAVATLEGSASTVSQTIDRSLRWSDDQRRMLIVSNLYRLSAQKPSMSTIGFASVELESGVVTNWCFDDDILAGSWCDADTGAVGPTAAELERDAEWFMASRTPLDTPWEPGPEYLAEHFIPAPDGGYWRYDVHENIPDRQIEHGIYRVKLDESGDFDPGVEPELVYQTQEPVEGILLSLDKKVAFFAVPDADGMGIYRLDLATLTATSLWSIQAEDVQVVFSYSSDQRWITVNAWSQDGSPVYLFPVDVSVPSPGDVRMVGAFDRGYVMSLMWSPQKTHSFDEWPFLLGIGVTLLLVGLWQARRGAVTAGTDNVLTGTLVHLMMPGGDLSVAAQGRHLFLLKAGG